MISGIGLKCTLLWQVSWAVATLICSSKPASLLTELPNSLLAHISNVRRSLGSNVNSDDLLGLLMIACEKEVTEQ